MLDLEAQRHHARGDDHLGDELDLGRGAEQVVVEPEQGDADATSQQAPDQLLLPQDDGPDVRLVDEERRQRHVEGDDDGDAAQAGDVLGVDLPVREPGGVYQAPAARQRDAGEKRQEQADQVGIHAMPVPCPQTPGRMNRIEGPSDGSGSSLPR